MRISHGTRLKGEINNKNGYGYATENMLASLNRLGYQVNRNDTRADVEIWFDQPHHWKFSKGTYKIGYHPWESTELKEGWADIMNECDEIWTPSPLIADWYARYSGIKVPIFVYEHGVDHVWSPQARGEDDKIRFLHVGAEATRKGGWDTMKWFRKAFPNRTDVQLTLKVINTNWTNLGRVGKTNIINAKYSFNELQELFYMHDAYVYPSWGEGFGLTPLQAMATGMPTISTAEWAPYAGYMDERLIIGSELYHSPWQEIHPGKMLKPNWDDVVDNMRFVADNFDDVSKFAMSQTEAIHKAYDWDTITAKVFGDLEKRLK